MSLIKDPNGENIFSQAGGETELTVSMNGRKASIVDEQVSRIMQLEAKIVQLEEQIKQQKVCIWYTFNQWI